MNRKKELLKSLPGFLAALQDVLARGFFESFNISFSTEYDILSLQLSAKGKIPDKRADRQIGILPYLNLEQTLDSIKSQLVYKEIRLSNHTCKIDTKEWPEWNEEGTDVIGILGSTVEFHLCITGREKRQRKK